MLLYPAVPKCYLSVGVVALIEVRLLPFSLQLWGEREGEVVVLVVAGGGRNLAIAVTFYGDGGREASTQSRHLRLLDITLLPLP